jgi:hypothetical protein
MTAPVLAAEDVDASLASVAAWNVPLVRGAVALLAAVAARLPAWRLRLGDLGRSLQDPRCWSGPAAQTAAASVFELSAVAAAVDGAIAESLVFLQRMAGEVEISQELALQALRSASSAAPGQALWSAARLADLVPGPAPGAVSVSALEHAVAASRAARAAADPVDGLTGIGEERAATFGELVATTVFAGPVLAPPVPVRSAPGAAAAWWASLSVGAQLAVVRAAPAAVGRLDGLPAWARDRANRLVLTRALLDPATPDAAAAARAISRRIAGEESRGQQVQLQLLDLAGDRVVMALGDLDTADEIALLVPGIGNTPDDDLGRLAGDAEDLATAARAAAPGTSVATVVWLGYRTPRTPPEVITRTAATRGGAALSVSLAGLGAARDVAGAPRARTTVLAHSYGTVVVDEAADVPGRLAADAVVLLGSPGMEDDARALEAPEVFDAAALTDPIAHLCHFGSSTDMPWFGATELPVEFGMGHSAYYDVDRPTLAAMGEVVAGVRAP